jgi:hypothetical protein
LVVGSAGTSVPGVLPAPSFVLLPQATKLVIATALQTATVTTRLMVVTVETSL